MKMGQSPEYIFYLGKYIEENSTHKNICIEYY